MRLLTRYVLLELIKVFAISLTALTLFMIVGGLLREAQQEGLEPKHILRIVPYILPEALRFTVPGTMLLAASIVYGRMSGSNEIVALKSLGISPMVVLWPVLLMSFLVSIGTVWMNELAVTWGRAGIKRVVIESVEEIAYSMLRTQRSYSSGQFSIIVKDVQERTLIQPTISFLASGDTPSVTLTAEEAELRSDLDNNLLTILCTNGTLEVKGQGQLRFHDTIERVVPLDQASTASPNTSPSALPFSELAARRQAAQQEYHLASQENATKAAYQMLMGDIDALTSPEWHTELASMSQYSDGVSRMLAEPHRRWSSGFSCLCFALVGAATAIRLRNSDFLTSFFVCFLPILLVYYPLLMFGVDQAKRGGMPPQIVWIGNVVLLLAAGWQLRKVMRY